MASITGAGAGFRILLLLLMIVVLSLGGLLWFDYLGVVDARNTLAPIFRVFGLGSRAKIESVEDPLLLEKERLEMQQEAIVLREQELEQREAATSEKEAELLQMIQEVQEREQALEDREKAFNEKQKAYENRRENLIEESKIFTGMPPQSAVDILLERDDQDIIDLFRITEELALAAGEGSLVSYWVSLMPAPRAADILRKMAKKTNETNNQ